MISKKNLIINQYLHMNTQLNNYIQQNIFPDFIDVVDFIFYFNYNFLDPSQYAQTVDNILDINKIQYRLDQYFQLMEIMNHQYILPIEF